MQNFFTKSSQNNTAKNHKTTQVAKNDQKFKIWNLKILPKVQFSTLLVFFLLQRDSKIIFFQIEKSESTYLFSLYSLLQKPQKMADSAEKPANWLKSNRFLKMNTFFPIQHTKTIQNIFIGLLENLGDEILSTSVNLKKIIFFSKNQITLSETP